MVEQSLEFFLVDLLKKCEEVAQEHSITKLTPQVLKKALHSLESYEFLKDALDDVEDLSAPALSKPKSSGSRQPKRAKPDSDPNVEKEKSKKGRKKQKLSDNE